MQFSMKIKKEHDLRVTRWISEEARPLHIIEDPGLKEWVEHLTGGAYTPPCFDTVRSYLFELSACERNVIKKEIKDLQRQGMSLTLPACLLSFWPALLFLSLILIIP